MNDSPTHAAPVMTADEIDQFAHKAKPYVPGQQRIIEMAYAGAGHLERIAELEAENERMREALRATEDLVRVAK